MQKESKQGFVLKIFDEDSDYFRESSNSFAKVIQETSGTKPFAALEPIEIPPSDIKTSIYSKAIALANKMSTSSNEPEQQVWPDLTLADINTTFRCFAELREGYNTKLVIMENRYLAIDNRYAQYMMRTGGYRNKITSFLTHLATEIPLRIKNLMVNIRSRNNVDGSVEELCTTVHNMAVFLHNFEIMKGVYRGDSSVFSKLAAVRDSIEAYRRELFREMVVCN